MSATSNFLSPEVLSVEKFLTDQETPRKVIPSYQRGYSWTGEKITELMHDIDSAMFRNERYFLGTMLFRRGNEQECCEIVDGQQRLVSLTLIFAWAMHWADKNKNPSDICEQMGISSLSGFKEELKNLIYRRKKPFSQNIFARIELGDSDKQAYSQILDVGPLASKNSEHKRFQTIYNAIGKYMSERIKNHYLHAGYLKKFVQFLAGNVFITGIFILDKKADVYEIFEVLNARGLGLKQVDLIKNKTFSFFKEGDKMSDSTGTWEKIYTACNNNSSHMGEYIRSYLQMTTGKKTDSRRLYRDWRNMLEDNLGTKEEKEDKVLDLLHFLNDNCRLFNALFSKDDHYWKDFDSKIRADVEYLHEYRVVHTLMFSILYSGKPKDFVCDAFRMLNSFIKRTRAVREKFSNMEYYEKRFAELAKQFKDGSRPGTARKFLDALKEIDDGNKGLVIIPHDNFIKEMSHRRRINDKDARLTLADLYNFVEQCKKSGVKVDIDNVTLEHILPKKFRESEWPHFQEKDISLWMQRIGNLALLHSAPNSKASNKDFEFKKNEIYSKEKFELTKNISKCPDWTDKSIQRRSEELAKLAAKAWPLDE